MHEDAHLDAYWEDRISGHMGYEVEDTAFIDFDIEVEYDDDNWNGDKEDE